jgi:hypothetical protein
MCRELGGPQAGCQAPEGAEPRGNAVEGGLKATVEGVEVVTPLTVIERTSVAGKAWSEAVAWAEFACLP